MAELQSLDWDNLADVREALDLTASIFLEPRLTDEELQKWREPRRDNRITVARHAGRMVASFRAFDTEVSLPGGATVAGNAISGVVVRPTHKRHGLLSSWMVPELARAADAGTAVSVLFASEATIYRRFGFGVATAEAQWTVDVRRTRFLGEAGGTVRLVSAEEARPVLAGLHEAAQRRCVGSITRRPYIWDIIFKLDDDAVARKLWLALHRDDDGTADGLLVYRVDDHWHDGEERAELHVRDLVAATAEAEAALWRYAASVDFITTIHGAGSPELALPHLLVDARAAQPQRVFDGLWVRIHDVAAVLSARHYTRSGELTLRVTDPLDQASGTFRLQVNEHGVGHCSRVSDDSDPDLVVDIAALGTLLFGCPTGTPSLSAMVTTGAARLPDPARLPHVASLFTTSDSRWSMTHF